jgi:hypothetical protein
LALLVLALGSAGCVPNVAWLPDSGGFVYLGGATGRQILLHDAAAGRQRILVADTGANTEWPAVSPDGRRVAVARLFDSGGRLARSGDVSTPSTLQVVVYRLDGQEAYRSEALPWNPKEYAGYLPHIQPMVFWAPRGDKLLVYADYTTGIYDVASGRLVRLNPTAPWVFGATPILPGGDGFLALHLGRPHRHPRRRAGIPRRGLGRPGHPPEAPAARTTHEGPGRSGPPARVRPGPDRLSLGGRPGHGELVRHVLGGRSRRAPTVVR